MKVLITGQKGYLANKLKQFLENKKGFKVDLISIRYNQKEEVNLSGYDVIIHTAALVHQSEKKHSYSDYYNANVILSTQLAKKAIEKNISHFIFISSMAVFGNEKNINKNTITKPVTKYGKTKLLAEQELTNLFKVTKSRLTIIRPPIILGKDAPGNPKLLDKISNFTLFFPSYHNQISVILINDLVNHIYEVISGSFHGITHPQMNQYFSLGEIISEIRKQKNKKTFLIPLLNPLVYIFSFISIFRKAFKSQYYLIDKGNNEFSQLYDYLSKSFTNSYE